MSGLKLRTSAFTSGSSAVVNDTQADHPVAEKAGIASLPPWLKLPLSQVYKRFNNGNLAHALLVHGAPGTGKRLLVEALVAMLLCEDLPQSEESSGVAPQACGTCNACRQLSSGNHTDYRLLNPPEDKNTINVGDTRGFVSWALLTANSKTGIKVGVVESVEVMNRNAANSLLKTLEEPAAGTFIICIANWPGSLPATITSRCQFVAVPVSSGSETEQWLVDAGVSDVAMALRLADGAAIRALAEQTPDRQEQLQRLQRSFCDIVAARAGIAVWVERLAKESPTDCLEAYLSFTADIVRVNQGTCEFCKHLNFVDEWKSVAPLLSSEQWFTLFDRLQGLYRIDNASIKIQPVLETIFAVIWQQRSKQLESQGA